MQTVTQTIGVQGSGKTTFAKGLVDSDPSWKRINRDDLRAMIDNKAWSKHREELIVKAQNMLLTLFLDEGYNVVCDSTGFGPQISIIENVIAKWKEKTGKKVSLEFKDFTDVPVEVCIQRDLVRANSIGSKIILDTYNRYCRKVELPKELDSSLPVAIIVDLDGTLCIHDRGPYEFFKLDTDLPNIPLIKLVSSLYNSSAIDTIIFLSGREDKYKDATCKWLIKHFATEFVDLEDIQNLQHIDNALVPHLYMRQTDDQREDSMVKEEIYRAHIENKFSILAVWDDRNRIIRLWERLGLPVYSCGPGYEF